jgi:hypothetical protein
MNIKFCGQCGKKTTEDNNVSNTVPCGQCGKKIVLDAPISAPILPPIVTPAKSEIKLERTEKVETSSIVQSPIVETISQTEKQIIAPSATPIEETEPPNKNMLYISAGVLLFLGLIAGYFFGLAPYLKDKNAPRYYTLGDGIVLRSSTEKNVDYNKIGGMNYGSEFLLYNVQDGWYEGKNNGTVGFVASKYLVNQQDFHRLNSVFTNKDALSGIDLFRYRKAILDFMKEHDMYGDINDQTANEIFPGLDVKTNSWVINAAPKESVSNKYKIFKSKYNDVNKRLAVLFESKNSGMSKLVVFDFVGEGDGIIHQILYQQDLNSTGMMINSFLESSDFLGNYMFTF